MRLIDADKLYPDRMTTKGGVAISQSQIANAPTVEPEREKGKWIDGKCNRCGTHAPFWAMATTYYCSDYCPKCGADMREVQDDRT